MPTSSAFLRAARTSSVSSPICLPTFFACLPDFFTCLAIPSRPRPVPGMGMPRTFFGPPFSFLPRTTPPTSPAAAVATPVTTAVFEEPFELVFRERVLPLLLLLFGLLRELVLLLLADLAAEDRLLAAEERLFDAEERLLPEALRLFVPEPLLLLGLDPFELLDAGFRLVVERELAWAMSPSLGRCPRALNSHTPLGSDQTPWVWACG